MTALERKITQTWPSAPEQRRVRDALADYGTEAGEREPERVALAVVKLSAGHIDKLLEMVVAAKRDYRDVLMWAESPLAGAAPAHAPDAHDLRQRDREAYEAWLEA